MKVDLQIIQFEHQDYQYYNDMERFLILTEQYQKYIQTHTQQKQMQYFICIFAQLSLFSILSICTQHLFLLDRFIQLQFQKLMSSFAYETCQICDKQASFICGDCQIAKYCTSEHRNEHWRIHKQQCKVVKQQRTKKIEQSTNKARMQIRKRYFENFSHKIYDQCIVIAHQLFQLQKKHMEVTKEIFNQFQYGISVCILCRTYLTINRRFQAKQEIDNYIREKIHFLEDLRNIPSLKQVPSYPLRAKQFLQKKLTLISAVTNIYNELKENCIKYYQIYTNHIELVFGQDSLELSNVYFCIGTYYKQINQITKSIACFVKAATIRGKKGGDCYVNISLLYRRQNRIYAAIDMMLTAIKLNQEQYGHNSREVGQVYQKLGLLYLDVLDFNNAILNLENALKIFINQKESDDYERIKKKIQLIYDKIKNSVDQEHLKEKKFQKKRQEQQRMQDIQKKNDLDFKKHSQVDKIFKISENLMNKLNPMELLRLSQLQLMLEKCSSQYAIAFTVGNSEFLKKLSDNRKKQFRTQNEKLFQLINIQVKFREQNDDF